MCYMNVGEFILLASSMGRLTWAVQLARFELVLVRVQHLDRILCEINSTCLAWWQNGKAQKVNKASSKDGGGHELEILICWLALSGGERVGAGERRLLAAVI